ncbi:MAG TPA: hypothetical protein VIX73_02820 [Kofleriaceae bacterium]|jgi:hypothetical protein
MHSTNHELIDITSELHTVTGGGKVGTILKGIKKAYDIGRPILKESAEVAKDVGVIGGVAYGAKKAWDTITGHGQPAPAAPQE